MRSRNFLILFMFCMMMLWTAGASSSENGAPDKGKILYQKLRCYYCHKIGNEGGNTGPDLTKEGDRKRGIEWQIKNLADPSATHLRHPENMPKFDKLTEKMFRDLAAYLESLR